MKISAVVCDQMIGFNMRLSGAVHLFHQKLNDLINNVPSDYKGLDSLEGYKVYKRENVQKAIITGGEAELEVSVGSVFIALAIFPKPTATI